MRTSHSPDDRETQPSATAMPAAGAVGAIERLEDLREFPFRKAGSSVRHAHGSPAIFFLHCQRSAKTP